MAAIPRSPSALEALARLRTMRGLLAGEDRDRFERLVADVEQAVWDLEGVTADLARLLAAEALAQPVAAASPVDFTDVVASALRGLDSLLASRSVVVEIVAPPAVFVLGDRDRLEHLMATALAIAAGATPMHEAALLRYHLEPDRLALRLTPYRSRDPRATIVEALACSQGVHVEASEDALALWIPPAAERSVAVVV